MPRGPTMPNRPLTVDLPDGLLARLRDRARRANRTVEAEILHLLAAAVPADVMGPADPTDAPPPAGKPTQPGPAVRAASNGARGSGRVRAAAPAKGGRSEEKESLPADTAAAVARIETLDDRALREAMKPLMTPKQAKRLADLNYKAQDKGLTAAEECERDELLHVYDKSMVVRAAAMAELRKRGVDVAELIGQ